MLGVTGSNGAFEPWRWWSSDAKVALHRRTPSLCVAHLDVENADLTQFVFTPLYESTRRHYAQRRGNGHRMGTVGPSANAAAATDAVIARWLHNAGTYAVQLFDAYGQELADCVIYHVSGQWQVRVQYLYDDHVTEPQSSQLLDRGLYSALAVGVKHGEGMPVKTNALMMGVAADEELTFGMANLTISPEEDDLDGGRLSDMWSLVRPRDSLDTVFVGMRGCRRLKTSREADCVPIIDGKNAWTRSPNSMSMECAHIQPGEPVGAIFPLVGQADVRKAIAVTHIVVSEYPSDSTDEWKPSIFRVWMYRFGYDKPIGTVLVVPNVDSYHTSPEPNTKWIPLEFLKDIFGSEDTDDAVEEVDVDVHIVGRLNKTPHIDPNLLETIEMAMWQLRYRREGAIVKFVSFSS